MTGKRFGGLVLTAAIAVVMALPAGASATSDTYFQILGPANGSDVSVIPFNPSYALLDPVNYAFTGFPQCHYSGSGISETPGGCTTPDYQRPTVDGEYTLTIAASIVTFPAMTPVTTDYATSTFELDQTHPVVSITPIANNSTNDSTPTFSFTATDLNLANVECRIGSGSFQLCGSTYTAPAPLADSSSSHTLEVRAYDDAGNQTPSEYNFFVDTVAPEVSIIYPTPGAIVDSSVPEINMAVDGATGGSFCRYDAQEYQSCAASWLGGSLTDGAHTLSVRAVDVAGNETVVVVPFFVDDSFATGPLPQSVSVASPKGTKVKRGKFKVKAGLAVLPSDLNFLAQSCKGTVTFSIKPKVKRAKTYSKRASLKLSGGRCKTSGSITLPAKYKGKRATLTARYHGSMLISSFKRTRSIKKL